MVKSFLPQFLKTFTLEVVGGHMRSKNAINYQTAKLSK